VDDATPGVRPVHDSLGLVPSSVVPLWVVPLPVDRWWRDSSGDLLLTVVLLTVVLLTVVLLTVVRLWRGLSADDLTATDWW